jgi:NAD(P)-dependent dehydrogenase (short-subunit alcohol dehydrogenase family)
LVNCAAAYERANLLAIKPGTFAWMQKVNVEVPLRLIRGFARHLIARGQPGSIINISSISAFRPVTGSCLNSCSKADLDMLTKAAALELGPYQIRVNGIAPGQTEMVYTAQLPIIFIIGSVAGYALALNLILYIIRNHIMLVSFIIVYYIVNNR